MFNAWKGGLNWCNAGWLNDGTVQYPITKPREPCGGSNNQPGIRSYGARDKRISRYDVFCYAPLVEGKTSSNACFICGPQDLRRLNLFLCCQESSTGWSNPTGWPTTRPCRHAPTTMRRSPRWATYTPPGSSKATTAATPDGWPTAASATPSPGPARTAAPQKPRCASLGSQTRAKSLTGSTVSGLSNRALDRSREAAATKEPQQPRGRKLPVTQIQFGF